MFVLWFLSLSQFELEISSLLLFVHKMHFTHCLTHIFTPSRAVAELPQFVNLELNGNQISEAGVEAVKGVLLQAGKVLGGGCTFCFIFIFAFVFVDAGQCSVVTPVLSTSLLYCLCDSLLCILFFICVIVDLEDNDEDGEDDLEEALAEFEVCMTYDVFFFLFYLIFLIFILVKLTNAQI